MFAVMKTGGKQYKVQSGDTLRVEKLAADAGETVQFNDILMLGGDTTVVGAPTVAGAAVQAEVIDQVKGEKLIHFVKRRRKHGSQRTKGHRQQLTLVRVTDILAEGGDKTGVKAAIGAGSAPKAAAAPAPAAAAKATAKVENGDDLTQITGVGPAAAKKLVEAGITTFAALAAVDPETFDATKVKPEWVEQAKTLA
ncbi:50S ribosomal protein L21 [Antarctobacter sp.]|uniref:50S ribosomal protein L21 n=1 Tax=Antarctobacter sp. TaxID=1872577 RepID=UPI002B26E215|nr:50S ribosomal protein L21 [Antarctobacter sp.]